MSEAQLPGAEMVPCAHGIEGWCGKCVFATSPRCKHGNIGLCGLCEAETAPKCAHGHPWFCVTCGPVKVT